MRQNRLVIATRLSLLLLLALLEGCNEGGRGLDLALVPGGLVLASSREFLRLPRRSPLAGFLGVHSGHAEYGDRHVQQLRGRRRGRHRSEG